MNTTANIAEQDQDILDTMSAPVMRADREVRFLALIQTAVRPVKTGRANALPKRGEDVRRCLNASLPAAGCGHENPFAPGVIRKPVADAIPAILSTSLPTPNYAPKAANGTRHNNSETH